MRRITAVGLALLLLTGSLPAAEAEAKTDADGGAWLAIVPAAKVEDAKPRLLLGWRASVQLARQDGTIEREKKLPGLICGVAVDAGPQAKAGVIGYVVRESEGRLALCSLNEALEETALLTEKLPQGAKPGGLAVWNQRAVLALTAPGEIWIIDAKTGKLEKQLLPDFPTPRSPVFDEKGRLWTLSANSLAELQFTGDGHFNPIHHRGDFNEPQRLAAGAGGGFFLTQRLKDRVSLVWLDKDRKTVREIGMPERTCLSVAAGGDEAVWTVSSSGALWRRDAKDAKWKSLRD